MSRRTRKMAANAGVAVGGSMTQLNSVTAPCVKHFFSCEETGVLTEITDIVGGRTYAVNGASEPIAAEGGEAGVTVNLETWGASTPSLSSNWETPGSSDVLAISIFKSVADSPPVQYENGNGSWYIGAQGSDGQIKVHPHFVIFTIGAPATDQLATPVYYPALRRTAGEIYSTAALKTGRELRHYYNGSLVGSLNVDDRIDAGKAFYNKVPTDHSNWLWYTTNNNNPTNAAASLEAIRTRWDDFTLNSARMHASHSACNIPIGTYSYDEYNSPDTQVNENDGTTADLVSGTFPLFSASMAESSLFSAAGKTYEAPGTWTTNGSYNGSVKDHGQDFYGLLLIYFADGAPDNIEEGIAYMTEQWTAGNKVIYPDWVTLS